MAVTKPFKGYRYNKEKIENPADVMAPPYDSISEEEMDSYYDKHPFNAVRLVSQKSLDTDTVFENCYTRSRDFLGQIIDEQILVREQEPAYYIYEETVTHNGENYYNRGIVALLELTDYEDGIVVPCEEPSTDSKNDRFRMISTSMSNNSLISCMFTERSKRISAFISELIEEDADMDFVASNGIRHRLWTVREKEYIELIMEELADKKLYIVDGHNRYEACLDYKNQKMQEDGYTGEESYNYVMTLISDSYDDGRIHLPVHRLVKSMREFSEGYFITGMQEHFHVEKIIVDKTDDDLGEIMRKQIATQRKEAKFAMYAGGDYFYRFTFKDEKYLDDTMPDASKAYRQLDLTILNKLVLNNEFRIDTAQETEYVGYTRSISEGMKLVESGDYDCLFVINPVRPPQFEAMTKTGEKLPKRAVSIFPKPATGIVIHKFE